jgi:hypothetical protein
VGLCGRVSQARSHNLKEGTSRSADEPPRILQGAAGDPDLNRGVYELRARAYLLRDRKRFVVREHKLRFDFDVIKARA